MSEAPLKPGDVRTFKLGKGNAVVLGIGIWAKRMGKQLHIHVTGTKKFHTTVTNDPKSERYHRTLFRDLRRVLVDNQCWPYGDDGLKRKSAISAGAGVSPSVIYTNGLVAET